MMRELQYTIIGKMIEEYTEHYVGNNKYETYINGMHSNFHKEPQIYIFDFGDNTTYKVENWVYSHDVITETNTSVSIHYYKPWYFLWLFKRRKETTKTEHKYKTEKYNAVTITYDDKDITLFINKIEVSDE